MKVFGSRVRVDSVAKVAELEAAEKLKMKEKVLILTALRDPSSAEQTSSAIIPG